MKINNFRGDLTDISAKKEALLAKSQLQGRVKTLTEKLLMHNIGSMPTNTRAIADAAR